MLSECPPRMDLCWTRIMKEIETFAVLKPLDFRANLLYSITELIKTNAEEFVLGAGEV